MGTVITQCEWCGENLSEEEVKSPELPDESICDECFHDHYEFTCDRCCEYELTKFQHDFLIVYEETHGLWGAVEPGIYEVLSFPYFGGPLIGSGWLYNDSLRKVSQEIDWERDNYYPCGHICQRCLSDLKVESSTEGKEFHDSRRLESKGA